MARWDPWRGCHRCSEGCRFCYIHKGDSKRGVDTNRILHKGGGDRFLAKKRTGEYRVKPCLVYLCFSSDFLLEEADPWRDAVWDVIRQRQDCYFLFLTKRIQRFLQCVPPDWGDGYDNVVVCCTVENQENADRKLSLFQTLPIKHKQIVIQPMIGPIHLEPFLDASIESVLVGGESDRNARLLDYDWVMSVREQCVRKNVSFVFRQLGTHFRKDGKDYTIPLRELGRQARKAGIDYTGRWQQPPIGEETPRSQSPAT